MIFYFLQSVILGFVQPDRELFLISNYIALLFLLKYNIYVSRSSKTLSFMTLLKSIRKTYIMEKKLSKNDEKKEKIFKVFICLASVGPFQIYCSFIVGKGGHSPFSRSTPPFLRFPPFLKSKMSPPFIGLSGKQKHQITLVTNLHIISTLRVS